MTQRPRPLHPGRSPRDLFGAELRHWRCLREMSQGDLARLTHFSRDLIAKVEKAERWPRRDLTEACDQALDTGGALVRIWPWVETEHQYALDHADHADIEPAGSGNSVTDKAGSSGAISAFQSHTGRTVRAGGRGRGGRRSAAPAWDGGGSLSLEEQVSMAAHESAQFSDHPSNVGPAALDQLRTDATRLARSFANGPRLDVFARARWLRDRAFALLDSRQRVSESRELYLLAGATCGMLAEITQDLGFNDAGMVHTRTGLLCAQQSGHNGLLAWIRAQQSMIAYYDGRFSHAAEFARRGQELAPTGTISVRLPALEARAAARLGNAEAARSALTRVGPAREQVTPNELDELGGIASFPVPKQHHYGAESYLNIGDRQAVAAEADACLTGYQNGPADERAYDNMASTRINFAQALVADDLEAARQAVQPAFDIAPELRTSSVRQRFQQLHGRLCTPAVWNAPVAVELRDQIEHFLADDTASPLPA